MRQEELAKMLLDKDIKNKVVELDKKVWREKGGQEKMKKEQPEVRIEAEEELKEYESKDRPTR